MRFLLIVFLVLAAVQQPESVALTDFPVPAWPANGVIPPELKDRYVFVDLAKNEYVLAYPENLGTESFEKDGPGPLKTARYELHRNVEPVFSVAVTQVQPDKYKYVYTVTNGAAAKQSIDQWALSLPAQARDSAIKEPAGWFSILQTDRAFKVSFPEWFPAGTAAIWSFRRPEEVIGPGTSKTGFELESALRPGFTVGYARKSESIEAKIATHGAGLPKAVQDQIDLILAVEYNSQTRLAIAPKFDRATNDQTIAADFTEGIDALIRLGTLNQNSDFVRNTLNELKSSPIRLTEQPRNPVETEILNALKLSLRAGL